LSIWFVVWILISAALLFFLAWTIFILLKQKALWKNYAKQNKLRFKPNSFFIVPEMSGLMGAHSISLFGGEHSGADQRFSRKMTAIEIQLSSKMPVDGGIASEGMVEIVQGMGFKEEYSPKYPKWDKAYIASAASKNVLAAYLTEERLAVITDLMALENAWIILVFKGDVMLLRLDTPDPLFTKDKLDNAVQKMLAAAKVLELDKGEARILKEESVKSPKKSVSLSVDEDELENTGLELEDDAANEPDVPKKKAKPKPKKKVAAKKTTEGDEG